MPRLWSYIAVAVVLWVACIFLFFRLRALFFLSHRTAHSKDINFCMSQDAIILAQKEQFNRAKIDLFGNAHAGFQGDDFEFYKNSFGAVEVLLENNPLGLTALSYYRIYKNANDNIRSLLAEYAYYLDGNQREYHRRNCTFNLECLHRRLHNLTPASIKTRYFPQHHRRYAFTFTREPLSRFISAVTEIEYRAENDIDGRKNSVKSLFQNPVGSQQRFHEFIKMIVMSGGSQNFYRENKGLEITHITPQIGTVLLGAKVEEDDFHIFKLEDFETSWANISESTNIPLLDTLRKRRGEKEWPSHPSSKDPYNTTLAARSFLSYAGTDAYHRFGNNLGDKRQGIPVGFTVNDYPRVAKQYLRVLCRLYLADFVCLNYSLPLDCQDLAEEMQQSFQEYAQSHLPTVKEHEMTLIDHLRDFLPNSFMRTLANYLCVFAESPECEVHIIHGQPSDEIERHDEL